MRITEWSDGSPGPSLISRRPASKLGHTTTTTTQVYFCYIHHHPGIFFVIFTTTQVYFCYFHHHPGILLLHSPPPPPPGYTFVIFTTWGESNNTKTFYLKSLDPGRKYTFPSMTSKNQKLKLLIFENYKNTSPSV